MNLPDGAFIDADGVWTQIMSMPGPGRAALFLDRDGVLIEEGHYLCRADDVRLIPGAAGVISAANGLGVPVVIVTNQGGIGRGFYGWDDFAAVQERMLDELAAAGARVDGVYASPFHPEGVAPYDQADHPARKPNPGMMLMAADRLELDLARSWIIGDHASDLKAAKRAGLAGGLHVMTGHGAHDGEREAAMALSDKGFRALAAESIADAPAMVPLLGPTYTKGHYQ